MAKLGVWAKAKAKAILAVKAKPKGKAKSKGKPKAAAKAARKAASGKAKSKATAMAPHPRVVSEAEVAKMGEAASLPAAVDTFLTGSGLVGGGSTPSLDGSTVAPPMPLDTDGSMGSIDGSTVAPPSPTCATPLSGSELVLEEGVCCERQCPATIGVNAT